MAYTKKDGGTATSKVATAKVVEKKDNTEIEELKSAVEALKAQNELLMKMLMNNNGNASTVQAPNSLVQEATLVHLVERAPGLSTHNELSNTTIDMNAFGE